MDKDRIAAMAAHGETQPPQLVSTGALPPLTAAERMRRHRERRRDGLRCVTIMVMSEKNALVPLGISPGSKPLKVAKYERYARYRAQALPRIAAFRKLGNYAPTTMHLA